MKNFGPYLLGILLLIAIIEVLTLVAIVSAGIVSPNKEIGINNPYLSISLPDNFSEKIVVNSQPVSISDFTDADYGVTPDGTFFVSTKIIGNPEEVLLTIIESDSTNTKNKEIEETFENREIIRMIKEGNYYLGKSNKQYLNPAFYFKVDSWKCFPTFMPEKFQKEDILQNQCGGLLLKK
ncbi:MAG TPA: hypothetical protein VFD16_03105 [Candidatus Saccharimonadales bacterium]|nr:hypothetical protein [Candidatus Saccharimonadales bacterium]